ncbi:MAG: NAD+ synthase [Bacteroidales bacterium]|nr:NAD+ synthase [Bacteroidales bacterium]
MKIALAQLNYTIGAFEENTARIILAIRRARQEKAVLVVFSELAICGYPPLDLLEHKHFIELCEKSVQQIAAECHGIAAIIGGPSVNPAHQGKNLFNTAYFLAHGTVKQLIHKTLLPTYDIFDEYRYFEQNREFSLVKYKGYNIAVTVCEDLWYDQPILTGFGKSNLYSVCPMDELVKLCPDFVVNIAASPFSYVHERVKRQILTDIAKKYKLPVLYVNQTGAQTELIFDGGSMVINSHGVMVNRMKLFEEDFSIITLDELRSSPGHDEEANAIDHIPLIHDALVLGIKDYFSKTGFCSAVVGLSGGIDSAVTLVLACRALGVQNLTAVLLPSQYSSDHSVTDAIALARNLDVEFHLISIQKLFEDFLDALQPVFGELPWGLTEENIQARIRGNLLMAFANKLGNILLNTSNKSEAAVGYGTLYGDMSGGLSVLGDVYKADVYRLAQYINRQKEIIPHSTIVKPPSAELRPGQKDSDSLPEYDILDKILFHYIEMKRSVHDIIDMGIDGRVVEKTIELVNKNEYKRYQAPPVLRVSSKAFGFGRRMPLAARY